MEAKEEKVKPTHLRCGSGNRRKEVGLILVLLLLNGILSFVFVRTTVVDEKKDATSIISANEEEEGVLGSLQDEDEVGLNFHHHLHHPVSL